MAKYDDIAAKVDALLGEKPLPKGKKAAAKAPAKPKAAPKKAAPKKSAPRPASPAPRAPVPAPPVPIAEPEPAPTPGPEPEPSAPTEAEPTFQVESEAAEAPEDASEAPVEETPAEPSPEPARPEPAPPLVPAEAEPEAAAAPPEPTPEEKHHGLFGFFRRKHGAPAPEPFFPPARRASEEPLQEPPPAREPESEPSPGAATPEPTESAPTTPPPPSGEPPSEPPPAAVEPPPVRTPLRRAEPTPGEPEEPLREQPPEPEAEPEPSPPPATPEPLEAEPTTPAPPRSEQPSEPLPAAAEPTPTRIPLQRTEPAPSESEAPLHEEPPAPEPEPEPSPPPASTPESSPRPWPEPAYAKAEPEPLTSAPKGPEPPARERPSEPPAAAAEPTPARIPLQRPEPAPSTSPGLPFTPSSLGPPPTPLHAPEPEPAPKREPERMTPVLRHAPPEPKRPREEPALGRIPKQPAPAPGPAEEPAPKPMFEMAEDVASSSAATAAEPETAAAEEAPLAESMEEEQASAPAFSSPLETGDELTATELPSTNGRKGKKKAVLLDVFKSAWSGRFQKKPKESDALFPGLMDEEPSEAVTPSPAQALTGGPGAPIQLTDAETKELLRRLKKQESVRLRQELTEAKELEKRAKEIEKKVKNRQKLRLDAVKHAEYVKSLAPQLGFDPDRPITVVPEMPADQTQVEFTTVQEGRSYVRIAYSSKSNTYQYQVIEPDLTTTEKEVLDFLRDTLVRTLDGRQKSDDDTDWEAFLTEAVERAIIDHSILIDDISTQRIQYYLVRDFLGYGPIDVLIRDPMIEDISCDGPGIPVYIFHREYESIKSNVSYPDEGQLDSFVVRLAQRSGKHISIADPLLDATLPDKSRLQASLSREVTTRGSSFTIRKFRGDPLTPPDLVRLGTMNSLMAAWFWLVMEEGSSFVVAGGTASGKTTTLNAISLFIPPQKKIVSIEDTREINLPHENWIAGLTRAGFGGEVVGGKMAGTIDMYKLLESALRQRPEYLLVGEVRGPEAMTLFQAMATGHAAYSTLHADSVMSAVYRLENPPINVPRIMLQTLDAVAVQILARMRNRVVRRIKEITEIVGVDPETGDLLTNAVFRWDNTNDTQEWMGKSHSLEKIAEKNNLSYEEMEREMRNRQRVVEWMVEKGIRKIDDVANVVAAYYRTPETLLAEVEGRPPETRAPNPPEGSPVAA